ncbi:hypothetical protein [Photobacterium leiognathi]|uniref:hypothetical protein n=1 Tax=Photobacterium leiognathi TaxID=553611 RepID=UPI0029828D18|nr:hypothetical protein [Photobacterium leiognathi]
MNLTKLNRTLRNKHDHRIRFGATIKTITQENGKGVVELINLHLGKDNKNIICDRVIVMYSSKWESATEGDNVMFDAKLMVNSEIPDKKYNGKTRYQKELSRYVSDYSYLFYLTYVTSVNTMKRIFSFSDL